MSLVSTQNPNKRLSILQDRAGQFAAVRDFFAKRKTLEVDTPLLASFAPIDPYIDLLSLTTRPTRYLVSSPEYAMKRLAAEGLRDIYQLGHVFRKDEAGALHNPEFTMIEWYRSNTTKEDFLLEICDLIHLFIPPRKPQRISYREAYLRFAGVDIETVENDSLASLVPDGALWSRKERLDYLFATKVEPFLGREGTLTILDRFPPSEAALAKIKKEGELFFAERFECFIEGIEIGNGYHELEDATEQKERFEKALAIRKERKMEQLPVDTYFLKAMEQGFGDLFGMAIGFDRLMMLRHDAKKIDEILPFSWNNI